MLQEIANRSESVVIIEDTEDYPTFAGYNDCYMLIKGNTSFCLYYIFREEDEKGNSLTLLFDELKYGGSDSPEDTYNLESLKRENPKGCTLYLIKSLQKKDKSLLLYEIAMFNHLQEVEENKEKIRYYKDRNEKVCRDVSRLIAMRLEDE